MAMIPPPSQTMINTISKSKVLSSAAVPELRTLKNLFESILVNVVLTQIELGRR